MRRSDEFVTWLASDTDCSFSEWQQRRQSDRPSLWMRLKTWMGWK